MSTKIKAKPVKDLKELRLKMAEKFADLENGDISVGEAKAFTGIASVIVNSVKIDLVNNASKGVTEAIDFLDYQYQNRNNPEVQKGLTNEFLEKKPYEFHKGVLPNKEG